MRMLMHRDRDPVSKGSLLIFVSFLGLEEGI